MDAHLHLLSKAASSNGSIVEEGPASGSLAGRIRAYLTVGATISATFTIYVKGGGTINGRGTGKLRGSAREPSFGGTMTVTSGSGRFAHARGRGGFYGTLNRESYAMVVQTTGTLSY